jgi:glycosyltransferase involved in cell wall biosynthesis
VRAVVARRRRPTSGAGAPESTPAEPARPTRGGLARKLLLWASTPDDLVGWLPWALWRGRRLVRRKKIDAILASGPSFSSVLVGALLGRLTGKPLVADFRDAWVQDPVDPFGCVGGSFVAPENRLRTRFLGWLERRSLAAAGSILFTSDYTRETYDRAYPEIAARSRVLYNGVEESDFGAAPEPSGGFAFTYVGTLHEFQREQVLLFLRAFALALRREPGMTGCEVRLCGHRPAYIEAEIGRTARDAGIDGRLRREGAVPHARVVSLLKGSGAQILFLGRSRFIRPSKLSEYFATGRPILALALDGSETARHLAGSAHRVFGGDSADELEAVIRKLWRSHREGLPSDGPFPFPYPHPLNWKTATAGLAAALDGVSGPNAVGGALPSGGD